MAKNNKYICGINPKALEKYANKFFKQQGPRAYVKNDGGKIYFAFDFFAAVIPSAAYASILQPIIMRECPKDGEMLVRYSGKDYSWESCPSNAFDIVSLFKCDNTKCKKMMPTAITYSNSVGNYNIFKSDSFISAVNENFIEIFDVFSAQLFQQKPIGSMYVNGNTDFQAIIMPLRIPQDLLAFAQFADATNSKNSAEHENDLIKQYTMDRDRAKAQAAAEAAKAEEAVKAMEAAMAEVERLKKELEKAQHVAEKQEEAPAEEREENRHEIMAAPKERKKIQRKEKRIADVTEAQPSKADSETAKTQIPEEVPDGKQAASIVEVIKSLENLFEKLNSKYFGGELVKPVITVQKDSTRGAYGWCTSWKAWRDNDGGGYYEINICAETLNRPLEQTAETLLHEMVHLYNIMHEVKDTSRGGTYHNTKYKDAAQAHGLVVEQGEKYGWHKTSLTEEALDWLHGTDFSGFTLYRPAIKAKPTVSKSSSRKYVCPRCGAIVRATKEVRIICADCDEEMLLEE